jgi:tetratricopeptide (TPR) repeat protein
VRREVALALSALAWLPYAGCRGCAARDAGGLHVEYAGCRSVLEGPVCIPRPNRQVVLWIADAPAAPVFTGAKSLGPPADVQGGQRHRLELEEGATRLQVTAGARAWTLAIGPRNPPAWSAEVDRLLRARQLDQAEALLRQTVDSGPADERGRALGALARVTVQRGDREQTADLLRRAVQDHRARGRTLDHATDAAMLVYMLQNSAPGLDEARLVLASLPAGPSVPAEAVYQAGHFGGLVARTTGDLRTAVRRLSDAAQQAERVGLDSLQRTAELVLAASLQELGRQEDAQELVERLVNGAPRDLPRCERAQILATLGWNRLLVREAGGTGPGAVPVLEEALAALGEGCPALPTWHATLRLNLALAHLQDGDLRRARVRLDEAAAVKSRSLPDAFWQNDLEGRFELAEGRAGRALRRYQELDRLAEATLDWGAQWRAASGRAQALQALGRGEEALAAYARADELLNADSLQVPVQDGREAFIAGREAATRRHLDLLLRTGRTADALALARRSHARVLSALSLGERLASLPPEKRRAWDGALSEYRRQRDALAAEAADDWKLPADRLPALRDKRAATRAGLAELLDTSLALLGPRGPELRAPREGEALIVIHPLPQGEAGFVADANGVEAARLDCLATPHDPQRLGACLLGPFAGRIRSARQVTLLPFGRAGEIDIHALPFDGAPLVAGRSVSWTVDLPAPGPRASDSAVALIVSDPRGDLPAARREARAVESLLGAAGRWRLERRDGAGARDAEVRGLLARVDLFHFAGHAEFTGRGGWDSALPLADSAGLTIADILALERAPRWAVLSGCETGRSSRKAGESLGLAQAFLIRGSQAVVATSRPVSDQASALLVEGFYRQWSAGVTPATALQQAQLALRRSDAAADWSAFRLLER